MDANRGPGDAGPSGFRNLEPVSREQRQASGDKDYLEKSRIQARRRGPLQPPENVVGNPVVPPRNAPAFCGDHDRFNRDVAGTNHQQKQQSLQKKEEHYAVKRAENYQRESSIWASDTAAERRETTRYDTARSAGTGARRNQGGASYDIISMGYTATTGGQALSSKDAAVKEQRQGRAANLYSKSHSVAHNIITGEPLQMPMPAKPQH